MVGPNLGNGHSSAMVLIEAQAKYIADGLELLDQRALQSFEVRKDVEDDYNRDVQAALAGTVWNAGGCSSYYLYSLSREGENGRSAMYAPSTKMPTMAKPNNQCKAIKRENAVKGMPVPLHPGAAKYYKEVGLIK